MNIEMNMVNGQLPNLDLINLLVKLADKFALVPTVFNHKDQISWWDVMETCLKAAYSQAFVFNEGLHSVFGRYGIQAITIRTGEIGSPLLSFSDLGQICEGTLRSLNNILEKFHQSYFLYIMPNARSFISVAYYMPCIGLMMLPLVILMLRQWFIGNVDVLATPNSFLYFHLIGASIYVSVITVETNSLEYFRIIPLIALVLPYHLFFSLKPNEIESVRFLFNIEFSLFCGCLSLLNFSLALFIGFITVPLVLLISFVSLPKIAEGFFKIAAYAVHPVLISILYEFYVTNSTPTWKSLLSVYQYLTVSHFLYHSFTLPLICFALVPLWNILLQSAFA
ncbi:hypothetical protein AB6A40_010456 [Gnathostoma spinigerum]|uniref:Uncharacterized protein n=1 Tax=Gnathostoma spinigerum TaxID=75299 RepID=A0ABD6F2H2_9BILA